MDSLLDALQEGRLIELPDNNRDDALHLLAHILEAIPSVPAGTDVVGLVMERERATSTALGKGWACPHARVPFEEEMVCAIGWSPTGIDYGSADGTPISVIAMYLVPSNQRNHYLREISLLAKALSAYPDQEKLRSAKDLDGVRNYLLDLIGSTKDTVGPDARASTTRTRFSAVLLSIFAAMALALSVVGVYGVMSYAVARRGREIGIRVALGARERDVLRSVMASAFSLTLTGLGVGAAAALAITRVLSAQLYGISATDPATLAAVAALLAGTALAASYVPARRAMRLSALDALRYQ